MVVLAVVLLLAIPWLCIPVMMVFIYSYNSYMTDVHVLCTQQCTVQTKPLNISCNIIAVYISTQCSLLIQTHGGHYNNNNNSMNLVMGQPQGNTLLPNIAILVT